MTDILIRGMEMPSRCEDCDFACEVSTAYETAYGCDLTKKIREKWIDTRPYWCPLQELPEHGDLIDVRKIREEIDDIWDGRPLAPIGAKVLSIIDSAPVIIPANKEESE